MGVNSTNLYSLHLENYKPRWIKHTTYMMVPIPLIQCNAIQYKACCRKYAELINNLENQKTNLMEV